MRPAGLTPHVDDDDDDTGDDDDAEDDDIDDDLRPPNRASPRKSPGVIWSGPGLRSNRRRLTTDMGRRTGEYPSSDL
jgi:hypothetical protein